MEDHNEIQQYIECFVPDCVSLIKVYDTNWDDDSRLMIMWKEWFDFSLNHYFTSNRFLEEFADELSVCVLHLGIHGPFPLVFELHPRPNAEADNFCLGFAPHVFEYTAKHKYKLRFIAADHDQLPNTPPNAWDVPNRDRAVVNGLSCSVTFKVKVNLKWTHTFDLDTTKHTFDFDGCDFVIDVQELCPKLL
jgi:hypothetical protein